MLLFGHFIFSVFFLLFFLFYHIIKKDIEILTTKVFDAYYYLFKKKTLGAAPRPLL